jgi:hypothetical protein
MATAAKQTPTETEIREHQEKLQKALDLLQGGLAKSATSDMTLAIQFAEDVFKNDDEAPDLYGPLVRANIALNRRKMEDLVGVFEASENAESEEQTRAIIAKARDGIMEVLEESNNALKNEFVSTVFDKKYVFPEYSAKQAIAALKKLSADVDGMKNISNEDINAIGDIGEVLVENYSEDRCRKEDADEISRLVTGIYELARKKSQESARSEPETKAAEQPKDPRKKTEAKSGKTAREYIEYFQGLKTADESGLRIAMQAMKEYPDNFQIYFATALMAEKLGKLDIAFNAYNEALRVAPDEKAEEIFNSKERVKEKRKEAGKRQNKEKAKKSPGRGKPESWHPEQPKDPGKKTEAEHPGKKEKWGALNIPTLDDAYNAIDKKPDGMAHRLAMTLRVMKKLRRGVPKNVDKKFWRDRNKCFGIDSGLPVKEQIKISKRIMAGVEAAGNPCLERAFGDETGFGDKDILGVILAFNGIPDTSGKAQKKIDEAYSQLQEIVGKAKREIGEEHRGKKKAAGAEKEGKERQERERKQKTDSEIKEAVAPLGSYPVLADVAREVLRENPEYPRLFSAAWRIYKGEIGRNPDEPERRKVADGISDAITISGTDSEFRRESLRNDLRRLLNEQSGVLKRAINGEAIRRAAEAGKTLNENFRILLMGAVGEVKAADKITEYLRILSLAPADCRDAEERGFLTQAQSVIKIVFYERIPQICGAAGDTFPDKLADMRKKPLEIARKKQEIMAAIGEADTYVESFKRIRQEKHGSATPPPSAPPASPSGATPPPSASSSYSPSDEPPAGSSGSPSAGSSEGQSGRSSETLSDKPRNPQLSPDVLRNTINNLMAEVLTDRTLYNPDKDPASLAINALLAGIDPDKLTALKGFLLKPKLTMTPEVDNLLKDPQNTVTKLRVKLREQDQKERMTKNGITSINSVLGGKGETAKKDMEALLNRQHKLELELNAIENEKSVINAAIGYKNGTTRYRSTAQLLAMINYFIVSEINGERPSQADIIQRVESQTERQRENTHSKFGKIANLAFGVLSLGTILKPTMTATLRGLAKDQNFSRIGEEKLVALSKAWDNEGAVKAWVNALEGSEEETITKTVPRLITYMEMALRDGNMRYLRADSAYRVKRLVKNLKTVRHDYIINKIEREMSGEGVNETDRMNAYFRELNMATVNQNEITRKLISRKSVIRTFAGLGVLSTAGAAGAGLVFGSIAAGLGIASGAVATGAGLASLKAEKPETKKAWQMGAARALGATALGVGATFISGGVALPVLAAIPGLFAPELIKYRGGIKEGSIATGKAIASKFSAKSALVPATANA